MSEFLVGALEPTAEEWGLSELFVGVMLVPLVGNVAEHLVAVQVAIANKMDLSLGIASVPGLQIALFVTPVLVFAGILLDEPMTLVFNSFELAALVGAAVDRGLHLDRRRIELAGGRGTAGALRHSRHRVLFRAVRPGRQICGFETDHMASET